MAGLTMSEPLLRRGLLLEIGLLQIIGSADTQQASLQGRSAHWRAA